VFKSNTAQGGDYGFYNATDSEANTYLANKALDNTGIDCVDNTTGGSGTGGTLNTWRGNVGAVASPDAICD
jgi:hypothetical protein